MGRTTVKRVVETEEEATPVGATSDTGPSLPMFPKYLSDPSRIPDFIAVYREDPPEGYIGQVDVKGTNEETLKKQFGGRVLKIELRAADGTCLPNGRRILSIEADPIYSTAARNLRGQGGGGSAFGGADLPVLKDLFSMQSKIAAEQRELQKAALEEIKADRAAERDLRKQEASQQLEALKAERASELERLKQEAKMREDEREARFERERKAEREAHERYLKELEVRNQAEASRQREFFASIQQVNNKQTDLVIAAMQASKTGTGELLPLLKELMPLMGGGPKDPAVELQQGMVELLKTYGNVQMADKMSEAMAGRSKLGPGAANGAPVANGNGKALPKKNGAPSKKDRIMEKLGSLLQELHKRGLDPEQVIDGAIQAYRAEERGEAPAEDLEDEEEQLEEEAEDASADDVDDAKRTGRVDRRGPAGPGKPAPGAVDPGAGGNGGSKSTPRTRAVVKSGPRAVAKRPSNGARRATVRPGKDPVSQGAPGDVPAPDAHAQGSAG